MTTLGPVPPIGNDAGTEGLDLRTEEQVRLSGGALPDPPEGAIEMREVAGLSLGRIVLRRFVRHRAAMVSIVVLAALLLLAFSSIGLDVGPIQVGGWWRWGYGQVPQPINGTAPTMSLLPEWLGGQGVRIGLHPFGQDSIGHDMFAQTMRGAQQSIMILFVVGLVSTAIGTVIGATSGYFGGRIDSLLMRITDLFIIVPLLLFAAIVAHTFSSAGSIALALVLGVLSWTPLARLVRGEVLALREREFVEAARVAGAGAGRIIFRHILPNTVGVIIVSATLTMSSTILLETSLSYLGLGVHAPDVSLGYLIGQYESSFTTRPWLFWYPGLLIVIIALCINFIGDGLRDAFDPRQRRGLNRRARAAAGAVPSREKTVARA